MRSLRTAAIGLALAALWAGSAAPIVRCEAALAYVAATAHPKPTFTS